MRSRQAASHLGWQWLNCGLFRYPACLVGRNEGRHVCPHVEPHDSLRMDRVSESLKMPEGENSVLAFGPFRLFTAERRLEKESNPVQVGGRALDLLIVLVERAGEVVPNHTLLKTVWRDLNVEEASLRFHIKRLRKILDDSRPDNRYVKNVPGRGYSFVAPVTLTGDT